MYFKAEMVPEGGQEDGKPLPDLYLYWKWLLAWPFTILQNDNITISWDFLRLTAPAAMPGHLGTVSLEKISWYRNIIIL